MSDELMGENLGRPLRQGVTPSFSLDSELHWYPMRVTYNRELRVKETLDALNIQNFLPVRQLVVERSGHRRLEMVPVIHNLLFIRSTRERITELKMTNADCSPLRYMMTRPRTADERPQIIQVPDRQMENFIRVASAPQERVLFLDYADVAHKVGRRVMVCEGDFAGVEGVVKRVKKNRHVVVELDGVTAVAIAFVPSAFLKFIDD
jgi:hypothetical protein